MLRRVLLTAVALGAMMAAAPRAEAVVTYTLVDVVTTTPNPNTIFANSYALSFAVSDAAVARGSFQLSGRGTFNLPPLFAGDVADFVSLSIPGGFATPTDVFGHITQFQVTFAPDRSVTSFALNAALFDGEAILSGSGGSLIAGSYGLTVRPDCNATAASGLCRVTGRLTQVPEPMSLALLGMGLLGMAVARRQPA